MNLTVANPGAAVPPGVHLLCYGPFAVPGAARSLVRFQPSVNMEIVHHLILFAGSAKLAGHSSVTDSPACNMGNILYAWARTGQTMAQGLSLDSREGPAPGAGYAVGPGSRVSWLAVQLHYQNMGSKYIHDRSGVELTFTPSEPQIPLRLDVMMSTKVKIPPRVFQDECVACRITRAGSVIGFRNHAHRLAQDIWTQPFSTVGVPEATIGKLSAQEPQIIRLLPSPRPLAAGQVVELHCQYDARQTNRVTFLGLDERTREMCNQYYVSTVGMRFECDAERATESAAAVSAITAAAEHYSRSPSGTPLGQVTAVASDKRYLYFLHRGPTDFTNTERLAFDPIVRYDRYRQVYAGAFGRGIFTVPHGLSVDRDGMIWATDVGSHQVFKFDPINGSLLLVLGDGRAAAGRSSFNKPTDVAVEGSSGDIYVADGYGNSRVVVFSRTGSYLREWGGPGAGEAQFNVPHGIALDSRGLVYVADRENARVQVFTTMGEWRAEWVSRVGAERSQYVQSVQPWRAHVSSIDYDAELDLFVVSEGSSLVLRSSTGCVVLETGPLTWPHDAILLRNREAKAVAMSWRTAGVHSFSLAAAELQGKRMRVLDVQLGDLSGRGVIDAMYG